MKCRDMREIKDSVEVTTKSNRIMTKGKCPVCGTIVCKIGGDKKN